MKKGQSIAFWLGLLLIMGTIEGLIMQKENLIRRSEKVFLPLAPRDPRSLMQGDYMVLRYFLPRELDAKLRAAEKRGRVVLKLDERGVGTFVRPYGGEALGPRERLLAYKRRGGIRFGAESFFFQEGHGQYWAKARFAELRLDDEGKSLLVGLRGPELALIEIPKTDR